MLYTRSKKHKFGAQKCVQDGIKFPSKLERDCYMELMHMKEKGKILFFLRQIPFDLPGGYIHRVDYCVFTQDEVIFIEAKGRDLAMGKLKREQVEELFNLKIFVVNKPLEIFDIIK